MKTQLKAKPTTWFQMPFSAISAKKAVGTKTKKSELKNNYFIAGYASTGSLDFQGERVDPIGLDLKYFRNHGWVDYEHDTNNIIGEPVPDKCFVDGHGLYIEAMLYGKEKTVKNIMHLANIIKKSGSSRHLGFSIEGIVGKRDQADPSIIRSIMITGVAVTKNPANPDASWKEVQKSLWARHKAHKSMETGYGVSPSEQNAEGGASPLRPQSLASTLHNLTFSIGNLDAEARSRLFSKTISILNQHHNNNNSKRLALMIFSGCSQRKAQKAINLFMNNHTKESED